MLRRAARRGAANRKEAHPMKWKTTHLHLMKGDIFAPPGIRAPIFG